MPLHSLMFGWEYPPLHSGGLGVACQGLVRGLMHHGVRVTLVLPTAADEDGVTTLSPSDEASIIRYVKSTLQPYEGLEEYAKRVISGGAVGEDIRELYGPDLGTAVEKFADMSVAMTSDIQPDVIHCHDWMTYGAGIRAKAYHKVPLVMHIHATEFDRTDFHPNQWIAERERQGFLAADKVIAVSQYTKNVLIKHYGIDPDKIAVVHNGHDQAMIEHEDTTGDEKRPPLVLFLGRLTIQKNPVQFLEMARVVHEINPDVQFVMAGDGAMLPELMEKACHMGLTDCMTFTGRVNRTGVDALYRQANCFVMPSISEPFGLVALEAIGNGVPVILSKQSGAAEVVEHAFHVDFWDTERFADCILTVLREQPLAEQLIAEAPRVLSKLNWQNQSGAVVSLYQDLIS
ncbi:MAG TPA: glycosyltransferase family 4 protein [Candidatus Peribacteraceae bacterium]|nr:glycosyltransferase family 4 protein [Candidatus Peribacteraceae bacterium]